MGCIDCKEGEGQRKEAPVFGAAETESIQKTQCSCERGKVSFHPSVFLAVPYREKLIL